jgi:hypothetical protein
MKKSDSVYILGSVFAALTALFYCCTIGFSIKLPRYYPLEHTWKWVKEKGVPSQGWYGMQAFAYLAAGIVTVAVYLGLKRLTPAESTLKPALTKSFGVVVAVMIVICMSYMLYHEFDEWGIF